MKTENPQLVKERAAGRQLARTFMDLLKEEVSKIQYEEAVKAFWEELSEIMLNEHGPIQAPPPPKPKSTGMSDRVVKLFKKELMPFGKFEGEKIEDVPLQYLDWLVGEDDDALNGRLKRYLKNEKIAEQLKAELEGTDE